MELPSLFKKYPELRDLLLMIDYLIGQSSRPASEVILTDQQVMKLLNISERKLDEYKAERKIKYSQERPRARCYWRLADILEWLHKNSIEPIDDNLKI